MKVSGQLHALVGLLAWKEASVPTEWDNGRPKADLYALEKRKFLSLLMTEP
jgi:hypothetical protein